MSYRPSNDAVIILGNYPNLVFSGLTSYSHSQFEFREIESHEQFQAIQIIPWPRTTGDSRAIDA